MNDKTLVKMLAGWSDSEFAVAASGEYCEDLKSRIEGVSAAMNDKWCGDGLAESEQIAFMRSRIEALEAALRNIQALAKKRQAEGGPDGNLKAIEGFAKQALENSNGR